MSNSISRSPSLTLVHDSLNEYYEQPAHARQACEDRLEQYLAADEPHVLERGRRLFDLVRNVPKPPPGSTTAAQVPALPGDLPDLNTYLSAARPLVAQIAQAVDAKSPQFQLARAALRPADIDAITSVLVTGIVGPLFGMLSDVNVDMGKVSADMKEALADSFFVEDALFRYAIHLSTETLQVLGSDQAVSFRRGLSHMQDQLQTKLPQVLQKLMRFEDGDAEPLNTQEQAAVERMEAWVKDIDPQMLAQLDSKVGCDQAGINAYIKRETLLVMHDALAGFDLDALAQFHKSPAGREIKAKEAELAIDKENGLLAMLADRAITPHFEAAAAEAPGGVELTDEDLLGLVQTMGLPVPEDAEQRDTFVREMRRLLQESGQ